MDQANGAGAHRPEIIHVRQGRRLEATGPFFARGACLSVSTCSSFFVVEDWEDYETFYTLVK